MANRGASTLESHATTNRSSIDRSSLVISDVEIGYGHDPAVICSLSLETRAGSIAAVMGPSGCGKSTLLHAISSLVPVRDGKIEIAEESPESLRARHAIGLVPQRPRLLPWRTLRGNIELSAKLAGTSNAGAQADEALRAVELGHAQNQYPHELSGGMTARGALARALVHAPQLLLIDEAFSDADEPLRDRLFLYVRGFVLRHKCFCLCVTHNVLDACSQCDVVFVLGGRPARVIATIQPSGPAPRAIDSEGVIASVIKVREALQ